MKKLSTVFFGTPDAAVPYLELLHSLTNIKYVVTQPDRPRGRGMVISPCPVKTRATELGLQTLSPEKLSEIEDLLASAKADFGVAVAYGKIFKENILSIPELGILNVHFSLLPMYRGAAPVQHALFNGEETTGVTIFWIDKGLDTGPVFESRTAPISVDDNSDTLFQKLIPLGTELLAETVASVKAGVIKRTPQPDIEFTLAPVIKKEDTFISFTEMSAEEIHNRTRGLYLGPHARTEAVINGKEIPLQLIKTSLPGAEEQSAKPGELVSIEKGKGIIVKCVNGVIRIETLRPAGKKDMSADSFVNGYKTPIGAVIFEK